MRRDLDPAILPDYHLKQYPDLHPNILIKNNTIYTYTTALLHSDHTPPAQSGRVLSSRLYRRPIVIITNFDTNNLNLNLQPSLISSPTSASLNVEILPRPQWPPPRQRLLLFQIDAYSKPPHIPHLHPIHLPLLLRTRLSPPRQQRHKLQSRSNNNKPRPKQPPPNLPSSSSQRSIIRRIRRRRTTQHPPPLHPPPAPRRRHPRLRLLLIFHLHRPHKHPLHQPRLDLRKLHQRCTVFSMFSHHQHYSRISVSGGREILLYGRECRRL